MIALEMPNGTRALYPHKLNKGFSLEFHVGYLYRHPPDE